ncbi:MAG: 6-hydroxypseudooxynicotine dehydrogenase complex subunit alpha [Alphaproteobacteria bacterium MarineAlpha3_Bin7]|nr:MAG: 6-hydroxypseudooxynicotine dehydrogenase complex subunit alpha [Alphaproteobacteria bacterium MarineAlpha3_Bin7]
MKPAPFKYHDPKTLSELVELMSNLEDAKILAGGQSLMPMMNMRYVTPEDVIDINGVNELDFIKLENDHLTIGSMTRQKDILSNQKIFDKAPIFREALNHVGHIQTRSRGTIGGSLCHLDPSAEIPALASLYDASLTVVNREGSREIHIDEWVLAYMMPSISDEEVLTSISIPVWKNPHGYAFIEFARRHGDFAVCGAGTLVEIDANDIISKVAIVVAGVDVKPLRLSTLETDLIGKKATKDTLEYACSSAKKIEAISDVYFSTQYRQRLAGTLIKRSLEVAIERARIINNDG